MTTTRRLGWLAVAALLGGCGGGAHSHRRVPARPSSRASPMVLVPASGHRRRAPGPRPQGLVPAETENRLLTIDLATGRVSGRVTVPTGPQYVAAEPGVALVTSPTAGAVTLLEDHPLRVARVFRHFGAPHITELSPDGKHAYVTDDARGTLTVFQLTGARVLATVHVGAGAHHMASSPDQRRLWIALGESTRMIVIVDTSDLRHPRAIGGFDPGFAAHDLSFSPDGRQVWVSSARGRDVAVFRAGDHRLLFRVPVGPAPQHIAVHGADAYLTSGYGRTIEEVAAGTGRVIVRARTPYGSFELAVADGFIATASLLDGRLAIYTPQLKRLRTVRLAPATRDVAITDP